MSAGNIEGPTAEYIEQEIAIAHNAYGTRGEVLALLDFHYIDDLACQNSLPSLRGATAEFSGMRISDILATLGVDEYTRYLTYEDTQNLPELDTQASSVAFNRIGSVGYIDINHIFSGAEAQIQNLYLLHGADVSAWILDLRGNLGGELYDCIKVASLFLDTSEIVTTLGRWPNADRKYVAAPGDDFEGQPLFVLIDENTHAGAAIISASLQDNGRAILLGRGATESNTIQTYMPLKDDGGALVLTTDETLRLNSKLLKGVEPDVEIKEQHETIFLEKVMLYVENQQ